MIYIFTIILILFLMYSFYISNEEYIKTEMQFENRIKNIINIIRRKNKMNDGIYTEIGNKETEGKLRYDLLPPKALEKLVAVYNYGMNKYDERNWELGLKWNSAFGAFMRHSWSFWGGEDINEESGLPHIAHAVFWGLALLEYMETHPELDDRPYTKKDRKINENLDSIITKEIENLDGVYKSEEMEIPEEDLSETITGYSNKLKDDIFHKLNSIILEYEGTNEEELTANINNFFKFNYDKIYSAYEGVEVEYLSNKIKVLYIDYWGIPCVLEFKNNLNNINEDIILAVEKYREALIDEDALFNKIKNIVNKKYKFITVNLPYKLNNKVNIATIFYEEENEIKVININIDTLELDEGDI